MDGGGDNQLAVRSLARLREAFSHYAGPPRAMLQGPDPGQGDALALQMAIEAFIFEFEEDSGFESGSEDD
ncbi:uncharacterized protein LOC27206145 [Drosophila simulans]|uniref:GD10296 n=1 Tax=Drosophila simulans TaxID=7240 RepID=B4QDR5_DROSI|nr:uncharacterized protein LOC27206145 [Drosophila simulans]EDX05927.1 GD10296 [Drosophila simulans]KMY91827.1 uncharacterized protein Dsimw501_GD10296 [Drosophila simulans]